MTTTATAGTLRIATRKSQLAVWQAEFVKTQLEALHPDLKVELVGLTTTGDRWRSAPLAEVGGKGLFIKELEQALVEDRADLAVHSMKDLPARLPAGFALPAVAFRDDVRDALICRRSDGLEALPQGARLGTASLRRATQLRLVRPDLVVEPLRGNVGTRLGKLDAGDFDAIVLATAGLNRLGLTDRITERLDTDRVIPAAGQGALGIECAEHRADVIALVAPLNDPDVAACVLAERGVCAGLGATCTTPLGVLAETREGRMTLKAVLASADAGRVVRGVGKGDIGAGAETAAAVTARMIADGAADLMRAIGG